MKENIEIGLIILAAGESKRMGKAKQLLEFKGKTLLDGAIQTAINSECFPIVVVLGARADILKDEINNFDVQIVENTDWERGMSSSIRTGLKKILQLNNQINGVVIMVCDQPFVSAKIINQIITAFRKTNSLIVACKYSETVGVPALFSKRIFPQLLELENPGGAKKIIEHFQNETVHIPFEKGNVDIDTPEDFENLKQFDFFSE